MLRGLSQSALKSVDQNLRAEKNNRNVADLETKREETNNDTNSKLLFAQTTSTHLSVVENIQKSIRRSLSFLIVNSQIVRGREAKGRPMIGLLLSMAPPPAVALIFFVVALIVPSLALNFLLLALIIALVGADDNLQKL